MKQFEKKFKDKLGIVWVNWVDNLKFGKYVFVERNYEDDFDDEDVVEDEFKDKIKVDDWMLLKCSLDFVVQYFLEFIFNQQYFVNIMLDFNYDVNKFLFGKFSKVIIMCGFQLLKDLLEFFDDNILVQFKYFMMYGNVVEQLFNMFYLFILYNFGCNCLFVIYIQ